MLGGHAGGEHDASIYAVVGGLRRCCAQGNAYVHGVHLAGRRRGFLAARGEAAATAVEALHLGAGAHEHHGQALAHAVGVAQEELVAALFADGLHGAGDALLLVAVCNGAFHDVHALALGGRPCRHAHLLGNVEGLGLTQVAFVVDQGFLPFQL